MRSHNKWIAGLMIGLLGGCFVSYGYDDFDGTGAGGAGGNGGSAVIVCTGAMNSTANAKGPCVKINGAKRFGTAAQKQEAHSVAIDSNGNTVIGGLYMDDAVDFIEPGFIAPAGAGPNGFVAVFDSTLKTTGLATITSGNVHAVTVDNTNAIIAASVDETPTKAMVVRKWAKLGAPNTIMPGWTTAPISNATPIAVATDANNDIYVLGEMTAAAVTIFCTSPSLTIDPGIFVIKYEGATGKCQWAQGFKSGAGPIRAAAISAKNGIWITGSFLTSLTPSSGEGSLTAKGSGRSMFLIGLNDDGALLHKVSFSGATAKDTIEPAAIDIDIDIDEDNIYVTGGVVGKTDFKLDLEPDRTGAFVAKFPTGNPTTGTYRVIVGDKVTDNTGARATGVAKVNGQLYVSGTFAGSIVIDKAKLPASPPQGANTPFLANLDADTLQLLSIERFAGYGEPYTNKNVFLAGLSGTVATLALAGGWTKSLDFSQGTMSLPNFLEVPAEQMQPDIFVAKFTVP